MSESKKPLWKRWWFWGIIVVVIIIAAAASQGGGNSSQPASAPAASSNSTGGGQNTGSSKPQTAKIGDTVKVGKFNVRVNSIKTVSKLDDGGTGMAPSANGGKWLIVNITITNNDSTSRTIDTSMFHLLSGGTTYNASAEADVFVNNNDSFFLKQLNPGLSATGNIAFNVPTSAKSYQLQVDSGVAFANTEGSVTIDLK